MLNEIKSEYQTSFATYKPGTDAIYFSRFQPFLICNFPTIAGNIEVSSLKVKYNKLFVSLLHNFHQTMKQTINLPQNMTDPATHDIEFWCWC